MSLPGIQSPSPIPVKLPSADGKISLDVVKYLIGGNDISHRTDRRIKTQHQSTEVEKSDEKDIMKRLLSEARDPDSFVASVLKVSQVGTEATPPAMIPREYWIYSENPLSHAFGSSNTAFFDQKLSIWKKKIFPSEKPSSRTEVILLAKTLDMMLSKVDISVVSDTEKCYSAESSDYNTTFKKLLEIYNVGFGELIRQVYVQCAERGVVLDGIRNLYADYSSNCLEIIAFLKSQVRSSKSKLKQAADQVTKATSAAKAARYESMLIGIELKQLTANNESLLLKIKNQSALERRASLMKSFLTNQQSRNAMLLQLGNDNSRELHGNSLQECVEEDESSDGHSTQPTKGNERMNSEKEIKKMNSMHRNDASNRSLKKKKLTSQSTQTLTDDVWDQPLYNSLVSFCDMVRKTVTATEEVTPLYSCLVFNNPLESAKWAQKKMKKIIEEYVSTADGQTNENTESDEGVIGSFTITKKVLSETLEDVTVTLKEIVTRLTSFYSSAQFKAKIQGLLRQDTNRIQKVLTVEDLVPTTETGTVSSLQPPRSSEVCPLCVRPPEKEFTTSLVDSKKVHSEGSMKPQKELGKQTPNQAAVDELLEKLRLSEEKSKQLENDMTDTLAKVEHAERNATAMEKQMNASIETLRETVSDQRRMLDSQASDLQHRKLENIVNKKVQEMKAEKKALQQIPRSPTPPTTAPPNRVSVEHVIDKVKPSVNTSPPPEPITEHKKPPSTVSPDPVVKKPRTKITSQPSKIRNRKPQPTPTQTPAVKKPKINQKEIPKISEANQDEFEKDDILIEDDNQSQARDEDTVDEDERSNYSSEPAPSSMASKEAEIDPPQKDMFIDIGQVVPNTGVLPRRRGTLNRETTHRLAKKLSPQERAAELAVHKERRRRELVAAKNVQMSHILENAGNTKPKTQLWLLRQVNSFYRAKAIADMVWISILNSSSFCPTSL